MLSEIDKREALLTVKASYPCIFTYLQTAPLIVQCEMNSNEKARTGAD